MRKRTVIVSSDDTPNDFPEGKVWIKVENKINTASYIAAAIRMEPDELVVTKDLFGYFRTVLTL